VLWIDVLVAKAGASNGRTLRGALDALDEGRLRSVSEVETVEGVRLPSVSPDVWRKKRVESLCVAFSWPPSFGDGCP
jgi:hypothetical protein